MRKILICSLLLFWMNVCFAQKQLTDSLKQALALPMQDTSRVFLLIQLGEGSYNVDPNAAMRYGQQALTLAQRIKFPIGKIRALGILGRSLRVQGDFPKALALQMAALKMAENQHSVSDIAICLSAIGTIYIDFRDYSKAVHYHQKARILYQATRNEEGEMSTTINLGVAYRINNQLDSSLIVFRSIYDRINSKGSPANKAFLFSEFASLEFALGNHQAALAYQHKAIPIYQRLTNLRRLATVYNATSFFFEQLDQPDSSIYYAQKGLAMAQPLGFKREILAAAQLLAKLYEPKDPPKSLHYLKITIAANDALYGAGKVHSLQRIVLEEQERQRQIEAQQIADQNRLKQYALLTGLSVFLLVAFLLYRNNRQQQRANRLLQKQKDEITYQRNQVEEANAGLKKTLTELKSTQTQLIQREKMASLGELTAGIAHEIQNPLNFVNNFSELSTELIAELDEEAEKGNAAEVRLLSQDIKENLIKIAHHGNRASNIVKGMLEHSRTSSGQKKPTDLNALANEYLHLCYQGLRAKDKTVNCELITDFDSNMPLVDLVPQDIGRVLLNLYNNAFYAVGQRQKIALADYQPTVWVSTQRSESSVVIRVQDNGTGIPESVRAKIFQPFFTTKPTGEGTGLGLSLSYDIVTKGHGGTINVESQEGTGTSFIITLPLTN